MSKIFDISKEYLGKHKKIQILAIIISFFFTVTNLINPFISKYIIDKIIVTDSYQKLYFGLFLFFLISMLNPLTSYFKDFLFYKISQNISFDIRKKLFNKILKAKILFFDKNKEGDIVSRVINDGNEISSLITRFFSELIENSFTFFVSIAGMIYLSLSITLYVFLTIFIFIIAISIFSFKFKSITTEVKKSQDNLSSNLSSIINSIQTIKIFRIENYFLEIFDKNLKLNFKNVMKMNNLVSITNNFLQFAFLISTCIIFGVGGYNIIKGEMTLGDLVAFWTYFPILIESASGFSIINMSFQKILAIQERIEEYKNLEEENYNDNKIKITGDIRIENLNFGYDENDIIKNFSVVFKNNSFNALLGSSGSGKSTIFKILLGFYRPKSGKIYLGDFDIDNLSVFDIRKNISYVPQNHFFIYGTILENIRFNSDIDDNSIFEICKNLNIHEKIISLKEGYNTLLNKEINFSGGEKQRISIARAIAKNSDIIIFDEPTSGLDSENEKCLVELIQKLKKNKNIIVISHRDTTFENADKLTQL